MTMRRTKRYTNVTFTKRVDHEGGRHRGPRAGEEPAVCTRCGARYEGRRWVMPTVSASRRRATHLEVEETICPACRQIESGLPGGFVTVDGAFFEHHGDEIEVLLTNEAERAALDNPLGRMMTSTREKGQLLLTTTTEHLAQRLGHALEKAFGGTVRYDFSHENKVARVYWHRD